MAPGFYKENCADRKECEEKYPWGLEDYDIISTIEKNYLSNFYNEHIYAFNPTNDLYSDGYDWTKDKSEDELEISENYALDIMWKTQELKHLNPMKWNAERVEVIKHDVEEDTNK